VTEADTCRQYVVPKLQTAGWEQDPHRISEQVTFTDGRIIPFVNRVRRGKQKRADYLLRYTRDFPIAVVEAKAEYKCPADGLGQAKDYAETLGLKFAYATNGLGIVEFDYLTGLERELDVFPAPAELWARLAGAEKITEEQARRLLMPFLQQPGRAPRYYQVIAVNRVVQAVLQGRKRLLLTMATGTGKTEVAFQLCWKLWNSRWNRTGQFRRPKILYLTDRNILADDPKEKEFAPFGEARIKIEGGEVVTSRDIYFAIYQAIAEDESRAGLYREFSRDFFDLVIVDECHRGSAREDSSWRDVLDYFHPAVQLGMTATPLREETRDTYRYFGNPIYQYSLRQGIQDGFLAPYRVHRIITDVDAAGWRPDLGQRDRFGHEIPDDEYHTKDFERIVALRARTEAIARHLTGFLAAADRFAKTLVFCVDQEHALEMRRVLTNLNADLTQRYPDYVCRVTADEGEIGRGHLSKFQDLETVTPVILTTSQLLSTGVNAPMVKNIVLARVVGSMTEFKQIIGRGTRVRDDYGKYSFNILDYTGSATSHFADPDFDGWPALITEVVLDAEGNASEPIILSEGGDLEDGTGPFEYEGGDGGSSILGDEDERRRPKYYVDDGQVQVVTELEYELDASGKKLRTVKYSDYSGEQVRTLFPTAAALRSRWADPAGRDEIVAMLEERDVDFQRLVRVTNQPDADPFDLLCHLAFNAPLRTRRERAERVRKDRTDFFDCYGPEARAILDELLDKYTDHGVTQFRIPDALKVEPIKRHGTVPQIVRLFGGADALRQAVNDMQTALYAA
jgi:type I restriction enzyme R subunit